MITNCLQKAEKFEIQTYKKPRSITDLKQTHVAFSGSLFKHPYDTEKIILLAEPYNSNTFYYEFKTEDISYMEEFPSIVNPDGDMLTITRIWVKKKSVGIRCTPFLIEDLKIL